jgi:hypothetical protein
MTNSEQARVVAWRAKLQRFHETTIARSTVHRVLIQHGLNRLPANQNIDPTRNDGSATRSPSRVFACRWT